MEYVETTNGLESTLELRERAWSNMAAGTQFDEAANKVAESYWNNLLW